ncbi:MAG TPA: flagellar FlbD family protein [Candidatus Binatia bacterium]|nr:flagellar FlbD family protein [Candidatus Binatia bacterium]
MIHLTRLNSQPLIVNADLVKFIENLPDTVITLLTGDKLVVREAADDIIERIVEYHRRSGCRLPFGQVASASPGEPQGQVPDSPSGASSG